ncbi:hypothetical protein ACFE04_010011 [Oxalis oulophora]
MSNNNNKKKKEYIEHQVSKMDTLAGVAIKYGVEEDTLRHTLNPMPFHEAGNSENEKPNEKSVRRRSIAEASTPEWLSKDEFGTGSSGFSSVTGKGKATRPKSASRIAVGPEPDSVWLNSILGGLGDSLISDGPALVHKSSSTPNFQDQENGSSSVWPVSWSLKPEIFDGLPIPVKSKAALD